MTGSRLRPALLALPLLLALVATALGHYPMLEPDRAIVDPGQAVTIEYSIGHPFVNDRFPARKPRVKVFDPQGLSQDLTATPATPEQRAWRVSYTPEREGDYVFAWTGGLFSEPPQRQVFDFGKVVIHARGAQIGWSQVVGHELEIVPLTRPYGVPVGTSWRGQVLLGGQPMIGGVVEAETYTEAVPEPLPELMEYRRAERTDPQGCFAVTFDRAGWWLLSVATDGGPGEQGSSPRPQRRAVFWLFVGGWDESRTRPLGG